MVSSNISEINSPATLLSKPAEIRPQQMEAIVEVEKSIKAALETYSNVHRGSGHFSMATTHLYEQARNIVLDYLGLDKAKYVLIFLSAYSAKMFINQLHAIDPNCYKLIPDAEFGLSLGVSAIAVKKKSLPKGAPFISGGGTTKMTSREWIIWANAPDKFEAGTPAIINVIAFAKALLLIKQYGTDLFRDAGTETISAFEILHHDELQSYSGQSLLDKLRLTLIGREVKVPTLHGLQPFINLDNSASTPTFEPVWEAFRKSWLLKGQGMTEIVEEVKSVIAKTLNASGDTYNIIFTSNTTEAINLVAESLKHETSSVVLSSLLEHSSNDLPWRLIPGSTLIRLSVDPDGFIDMNELESHLSEYNQKARHGSQRIRLVTISGASNVLGSCNDMKEISRLVHEYGAMLLVDAAQLIAHRPIDIQECEIDFLAFSAHKIYAPFGSGALVVRKGLLNFDTSALKMIQSYGTDNPGGIAALGKSLLLLQRIGKDLISQEEQALTIRAMQGMKKIKDLKIYGINDPASKRLAHKVGVIPFSFKNVMPNRLANELAMQGGIGVRYGCHCAHLTVKRILNIPPFLEHIQRIIQLLFPKFRFLGVVRLSFGLENTMADVDTLLLTLENSVRKTRGSNVGNTVSPPGKTIKYKNKEIEKFMEEFIQEISKRVYSNP